MIFYSNFRHFSRSTSLDSTVQSSHYTELLLNRLRKAKLVSLSLLIFCLSVVSVTNNKLVDDGQSATAVQPRHINNRQHAITFRQEYIEGLVHEYVFLL